MMAVIKVENARLSDILYDVVNLKKVRGKVIYFSAVRGGSYRERSSYRHGKTSFHALSST